MEPVISAMIQAVEAEGYAVTLRRQDDGAYVCTIRDDSGEAWVAGAADPAMAVVEAMMAVGWEDMD